MARRASYLRLFTFSNSFLRRKSVLVVDKGVKFVHAPPPVRLAVIPGREIWVILDERERVDFIDEQEGQHVQNMVRPLERVSSTFGPTHTSLNPFRTALPFWWTSYLELWPDICFFTVQCYKVLVSCVSTVFRNVSYIFLSYKYPLCVLSRGRGCPLYFVAYLNVC